MSDVYLRIKKEEYLALREKAAEFDALYMHRVEDWEKYDEAMRDVEKVTVPDEMYIETKGE